MRATVQAAWMCLVLSLFVFGCERARGPDEQSRAPDVQVRSEALTSTPNPNACALLDNPRTRALMSPALELKLEAECSGAAAGSAGVARTRAARSAERPVPRAAALPGEDILVNDPSLDAVGSTQSETSVVAVGNVVCAAWNDSGESFGANGFSGFGYSLDGGLTFTDGGPFPNSADGDTNFGDPSLAYSVRDGAFFYAALSARGLSLWRSDDSCQSFSYVGPIHVGFGDDKELIAVDNTPTSPYFGRIHIGWVDFGNGGIAVTAYSDDAGASWTAPVALTAPGDVVQGMWPAVAPNGDVYYALVRLGLELGSVQDQLLFKSTDGGNAFTPATNIGTAQLRPESQSASTNCGRQALNGDIRNLSSPQIAIHAEPSAPSGYVLHAVYPYDSDGAGPDQSNVFYRQSADGGNTWSAELKLNDDSTTTDQFYPALAVSDDGRVAVSWYDRRLDPAANLLIDRFYAFSIDGGLSFSENERISDVSTPVGETNPHFDGLATCYHGDYDQVSIADNVAHLVWSDDRRVTESGPNPDVYYDQRLINPSRGSLRAAPAAIACGGTLGFSLSDADLAGTGSASIQVTTDGGDAETLVLTEDPSRPGRFQGSIASVPGSATPGDGVVQGGHGTVVTATYLDANDGEGGTAVSTAEVTIDCQPPEISAVRVSAVGGASAVLTFDSSEPALARVEYGFRCDALTEIASTASLSTTPEVLLEGLRLGTVYYFAVTAEDRVGNERRDDNGGRCYTFETLHATYFEDFEDGLGEFVLDNASGAGNGLWHLTQTCASVVFGHSVPSSLYYGDDASCTFDNGVANEGTATSPLIHVDDSGFVSLEFNYYLGTEGGGFFDQAAVSVSIDGGPFVIVDSNFAILSTRRRRIRTRNDAVSAGGFALRENTNAWQHAALDLTPLLDGQREADIQLRLTFATRDAAANAFAGFYVDDVTLLTERAQVPCGEDADCDDGLFCSGAERCSEGFCQPGTPVSCAGDDGVTCTDEVCDEASQACVSKPNDARCDDGVFCNGFELCDPQRDCQPPVAPFTCPADGVDCTLETCDEGLKSCRRFPDSSLCGDGVFCNGFEFCDPQLGCQPGQFPCNDGIACTQDVCDEQTASCGQVPDDAACDDGLFCTGFESCVPFLGCITSGDPCPGPEACDEGGQQCLPTCFADTNANHKAAGRAYSTHERFHYFAVGSNDALGRLGTTVTSLAGGDGYWTRVASCPVPPTIDSIEAVVVGDGATVSGTASDANGDLTLVRLTLSGSAGALLTIDAAGTENWSVHISGLPVGFYLVTAQAFDASGYVSAPTEPIFFFIQSPQAPFITSISASASGTSGTVQGTAFDPNNDIKQVLVTLFAGEQVVSTAEADGTTEWSATFPGLAPGLYTAIAQAIDATGIISQDSEPVSFEITETAQCITVANRQHAAAGRATTLQRNRHYVAVGSGDFLGLSGSAVTSLQGGSGFWSRVGSCP